VVAILFELVVVQSDVGPSARKSAGFRMTDIGGEVLHGGTLFRMERRIEMGSVTDFLGLKI
jgi:hypothetical protein